MKKFLSLVVSLVLVGCFFGTHFMTVAHAAAAHPATVYCSNDGCDGTLPHQTDGGSNCVGNITRVRGLTLFNHSGRDVGALYLYYSNTCNTFWSTVLSTYGGTEIHTIDVQISRFGNNGAYDADAATFQRTYSTTYVNTYADGEMAGDDGTSAYECYRAFVYWYDYANVNIQDYLTMVCY